MKTKYACIPILILMTMLVSCGSSSNNTNAEGGDTHISALGSIPDMSTLVNNTESDTSLSALRAVSGTPPILADIDESNVDTYFWDGLLAEISAAGSATQEQANAYWGGEGRCRMAQATGFSFQEMLSAGISLCYMKNAPEASSGVAIVSGSVTDPTQIFNQQAYTFTVKVESTGQVDTPDQNIFIRVYGTASSPGHEGYATDLWFCPAGGNTVMNYEQIRVNDANQTIAQTSVHEEEGTFAKSKVVCMAAALAITTSKSKCKNCSPPEG